MTLRDSGKMVPGIVVYTAVFGDIGDCLRRPQNVPPEVPLHAYTDEVTEPTPSNGWTLLPPVWHDEDPRRRNRHHKLLSHRLYPEAEYTLYVDGSLTPHVDPNELIERYLGRYDICLFKNAGRNCIYEELEACTRWGKDDPAIMRSQIDRYRSEGYPAGHGLVEAGAVLRRHSQTIHKLNEAWWHEVSTGSKRDQLSFNYVAWKMSLEYATFAGRATYNPYFAWREHPDEMLQNAWVAYWRRNWEEFYELRERLADYAADAEVQRLLNQKVYPRWVYPIKDFFDRLKGSAGSRR